MAQQPEAHAYIAWFGKHTELSSQLRLWWTREQLLRPRTCSTSSMHRRAGTRVLQTLDSIVEAASHSFYMARLV